MPVPPVASTALASTRRRASLIVVALFTFLFAAYILTASGDIFSTGDTTIRTEIAENISGRLSVDLNGWDLQLPHHYKKEWLDPRIDVGRGGDTYSTYLLGQPLAIIPFDWIGSRLAVHERWVYGPTVAWVDRLVGPLFGALEVTLFFVFAVRLGYGFFRSLLLTTIFGFATSVWPDEQSVLEHTEVGFFVLWAFYFAYRYRDGRKGWPYLVYSGLALGGATITRYQDAFLALLGIGLYLILPSAGKWRPMQMLQRGALLGLGLLPFVLIDLWFDWVRFGSITATGHHEKLFGYPISLGIPGLLVSPGKGFLWYCPTIFLLAIAAPKFARHFPALALAMAFSCLGFLLFYSHITFWHGDPAWGPRYLYPTLPLLTLPLGELLRWSYRWKALIWGITACVVGAGLLVQVSAVSVNQWRSWYRVVAYEESHGQTWQWIASRYRYFWNIHETPLNFQIHGLYQLVYDDLRHSAKYEIVPPDEDPVLDRMTTDYALNQWSFWWASNEFNWWMGEQKVILGVLVLISLMLASGTYLAAEASGVFEEESTRARLDPIPEAA